MILFKYHSTLSGHCQVNYTTKNPKNQTVYYSLVNQGKLHGGILFYRCSRDWEPDHTCTIPDYGLPKSKGTQSIDKEVNTWLKENSLIFKG